VAVVDPGVGTERAIVLARFEPHYYVAPDNGLLSRLARRAAPDQLITLTNRSYWLPDVSATFHGRDIMAPVAAHLSLGAAPEQLGEPQDMLVQLDWPEPRYESGRVVGSIQSVDAYGNLISDITAEGLRQAAGALELTVLCKGREIRGLIDAYGRRPPSTLAALIGSSGRLELAVVGGSAAETLQAKTGDAITVRW
jgi:S-adenosylmethionine hydrolase